MGSRSSVSSCLIVLIRAIVISITSPSTSLLRHQSTRTHLQSPSIPFGPPLFALPNHLLPQSFILGLRILELLPRRAELAQFVPHHILCHRDIMIDLAIVHLEFKAHEVREDGGGAGLRFDGNLALAGFGAGDGEAIRLRQRALRKREEGNTRDNVGAFPS